ncbi:unnamed protein product (macronuclear) [Paramecium tetraurelia]|uniref:Uncharacterized protein n=1 Tax=Paramecium tetraurelia TaxID=5888 RepID=A0EA80_PARTE|nr:uncharacterized protein GSPATT00024929001 [Paramecium tetraurelia]CAK92197.1 unnamed protein product [Paramecium tetraurelia]|eukprot:XP_001459594.1 hypothetical protein (macronuclear) [Paramecium tetraurelia strain d4-2]
MNQFLIPCPNLNHSQIVDTYCLNQACSEMRFSCAKCIFDRKSCHTDHFEDVQSISHFRDFYAEVQKDCDILITQLDRIYAQITQQFNRLIENLREKYQVPFEKLKVLTPIQINQVVNQMVKFKVQSKTLFHQIKESFVSFNVLLEKCQFNMQIQELNYVLKKKEVNGPFSMSLMKENSLKDTELYALALNKTCSIMIAGYATGTIKVFDFKFGQFKLVQVLDQHRLWINSLLFMKSSDCFISGSNDQSIIVWQQQRNSLWQIYQKLEGHSGAISCLELSRNEDFLISGSADCSIKFWEKRISWDCYFTLNGHSGSVQGLSLNSEQNQLISCAYEDKKIIVSQQKGKVWIKIQNVSVEYWGLRLCFVKENQFAFQPYCKDHLLIFQFNFKTKQFDNTKKVDVKSSKQCNSQFPQKWVTSKQILISKNGNFVNLIKLDENGDFYCDQSIDFRTASIYGTVSEEGEYMITWDQKSLEIQVRQYKIENK